MEEGGGSPLSDSEQDVAPSSSSDQMRFSPRSHHQSHSVVKAISNIKITNPIKKLVSQHRKRYTKDGFNLDLTYIFDNLIAMGYPGDKLEGVYRNHIDDVARFLNEKHPDHFKIYNLCAEKTYDTTKFHQRVASYPFDDHNPPCLEVIKPFCQDVHEWLSKDPENVAVVHCKAGKGRTGMMICCYMLHAGKVLTADDALNYYGHMRTTDRKGVTIPSQRRYVDYYATLIKNNITYQPVTLYLREIRLNPVPGIFSNSQGSIQFVISEMKRVGDAVLRMTKKYTSIAYEIKKGASEFYVQLLHEIPLTGDIKVEFFNKRKMMKKEKLFQFWFNTFFVKEPLLLDYLEGVSMEQRKSMPSERSPFDEDADTMSVDSAKWKTQAKLKPRARSVGEIPEKAEMLLMKLRKSELDSAHKDKQHKLYSADFQVSFILERYAQDLTLLKKRPGSVLVNNEQRLQNFEADLPTESSEGESVAASEEESSPDDEEEGWEFSE